MRNSKWPQFLLQQILFLFISSFIIDTGSPCARIGHHAPQSLSVLIRGFLGMLLANRLKSIIKILGHSSMANSENPRWRPVKIIL